MKKLLVVISFLVASFFTTSILAQELKVGVIDMNLILQKSPLMASLNSDLQKKFQPRLDELNNAQKKLQDENNKLNVNTSMSAAERGKLQNTIISDQANVSILNTTLQRDLAIAKDEALQKFTTRLNSVISKIAQDQKYDLIQLNTSFAFINSRLDITKQVLDQMK